MFLNILSYEYKQIKRDENGFYGKNNGMWDMKIFFSLIQNFLNIILKKKENI